MTGTERMLPLYEAKMLHQYDHRWATYEDGSTRDVTIAEKQDPDFTAFPRYWVRESVVGDRLQGRWDHDWLMGWRDICRSTDERTMIAAVNGSGASPEGGTLLAFADSASAVPVILAVWNSYVFDFVARQKVGGTHLKYFTVRQLPLPLPETFNAPTPWDSETTLRGWLTDRVLKLVLDASDMTSLADDFRAVLNPNAWDPSERSLTRAELDAAMFRVFDIARADVEYIMETFPIVKRKEETAHGEYRTKRLILEVYDAMAAAIAFGTRYQSAVNVPSTASPREEAD